MTAAAILSSSAMYLSGVHSYWVSGLFAIIAIVGIVMIVKMRD